MSAEQRLRELNIVLPNPAPPVAAYVSAVRSGNLLFTSGSGPWENGAFKYSGKLGRDLSMEEGYDAARVVMLNLISVVRAELGSLDRVERIVKVLGFVASASDFNQQPQIINGASDLLEVVFGESGKHARSAIGVNELPANIPVEIEMIVQISGRSEQETETNAG